jgi:hypothetical protein
VIGVGIIIVIGDMIVILFAAVLGIVIVIGRGSRAGLNRDQRPMILRQRVMPPLRLAAAYRSRLPSETNSE